MLLSNRVRLVTDYSSGSNTFLDPAELALSLVVIERLVRLSWEDIFEFESRCDYCPINKSINYQGIRTFIHLFAIFLFAYTTL